MKLGFIVAVALVCALARTCFAQGLVAHKWEQIDATRSISLAPSGDPGAIQEYRNYDQVVSQIRQWADQYPEIAKLGLYGYSTDGRPLYYLKISDDVAKNDPTEANVLLNSAIHGDEIITTEVLLALTAEFLEGYSKNQRLKQIIDHTELYIIPIVSPDGFVNRARRVHGIDPNRVFPFPEGLNPEPLACIDALVALAEVVGFSGVLDIHAAGQLVLFPWAYTTEPVTNPQDLQKFQQLVKTMAEQNRYRTGQISKNILGLARGASSDYFYWQFGAVALAVELTTTKAPDSSQIPAVVNEAREMTLKFVESFLRLGHPS